MNDTCHASNRHRRHTDQNGQNRICCIAAWYPLMTILLESSLLLLTAISCPLIGGALLAFHLVQHADRGERENLAVHLNVNFGRILE
ncbi:hypothetical protein EG68_08372 [Paragonimus skrjabini miyazakii]|uniref:Uncharacterized protein n=1 Tax=Paragonimus skrjabini miyazakii TaxID=59628 RepID=A0A8S9YN83_9TREM|nr:hypothetical protein EG68_08372 [Paragonimus skrjabini miyazakii]